MHFWITKNLVLGPELPRRNLPKTWKSFKTRGSLLRNRAAEASIRWLSLVTHGAQGFMLNGSVPNIIPVPNRTYPVAP